MSAELFVCGRCIDESGLRDFVNEYAVSHECSFCCTTGSDAIAAPLEDVASHINQCLYREYDDAAIHLYFGYERLGLYRTALGEYG